MYGMKDDGMRAMRLKAKSKYLDDLLEDNDGKMAVEIKKVYAKPAGVSDDNGMYEEEEEEMSEELSEDGLSPDMAKFVDNTVGSLKKTLKKAGIKQEDEEDVVNLSPEEMQKLLKELDLEGLTNEFPTVFKKR